MIQSPSYASERTFERAAIKPLFDNRGGMISSLIRSQRHAICGATQKATEQ